MIAQLKPATILALLGTFLGGQIRALRLLLIGTAPPAGDTLGKVYDIATAAQTAANNGITQVQLDAAIADLVGTAPTALNTFQELAASLNDDANAFSTLNNAIGLRVLSADLGTQAEFEAAYNLAVA